MDTRLILVEGMIGAGKSTTAEHLESWLVGRGEQARAYHEFAPDHPIRSVTIDRLRAAYPEPVWTPDDVGDDGLARDRAVYAVEQWGALARRCRDGGPTVVLESSFLQNAVMPSFCRGLARDEVLARAARIQDQLAPATPLLVLLRPTDVEASIRESRAVRGEPWTSWNRTSVAALPWAAARDLTGRDPVVELYRDWYGMVDELLAHYPYPTLVLDDPQADRGGALERVQKVVRPGD